MFSQIPSSLAQWLTIAQQFEGKWNFPRYLGAMDGKGVILQAPDNTGSEFYNYKSNFRIDSLLWMRIIISYNRCHLSRKNFRWWYIQTQFTLLVIK